MARDVKDSQWYNNPRPLFYSYPHHNNFYDSQLHNSYPNAGDIRTRNLGYSDGNQYYYHQMSGNFYQNYHYPPLMYWRGRTNMGLHNYSPCYYYPMPYQQNTTSNHIRVVDERERSPYLKEIALWHEKRAHTSVKMQRFLPVKILIVRDKKRGETSLARDGKGVELSEEAEPLDLKAMRVSIEEVINDEKESIKICVVCQQDLVCDDDDDDHDDDDDDGEDDDDDDEYDDDDEDDDDEYEDDDEDDEDYGDDEDEDDDHQRRIEVLECGHEFHGCCISRWLKYRNLCPLCKRTGGARGG